MLHLEHLGRVVDRAIAVVVVADRAVKHVVGEDPVESLPLRGIGPGRLGLHLHPVANRGGASPDQMSVDLDQAGVACLDGTELVMITNLGKFFTNSINYVDQSFTDFDLIV